MKVCFISLKSYHLFNPKIKHSFGGAEVQIYLLCKELQKEKNIDLNVLVADFNQNNLEVYNNIKIWKSLHLKRDLIIQIYKFLKVFHKINADVYIQRTLTMYTGFIALYCKITKKKFIYMVSHDAEVDSSKIFYNKNLKNLNLKLISKFSSHIIVQNDFQFQELFQKNINSTLIKSSIELNNKYKVDTPLKKYILWVGRSENWKEPELFLEVVANFKFLNFVMICPKAINNPSLFEKIKKKSAIYPNLKFISYVPYDEIEDYFSKASLFINTSKKEGFPNTFLQAGKFKVPIISLNVNPNDFINQYKCGIYCQGKFDKLIKAIDLLEKNKLLYKLYSNKIFEYVKQNHCSHKNSKLLLKLL